MLYVSEIYKSIQGESSHAGLPCVFIRLSGCHLRCNYCDTEHAFSKGDKFSIEDILKKVFEMKTRVVELTGGEPLLQQESLSLLRELCDRDYTVLLETSGSLSIKDLPKKVHVIMDIKTPSSDEGESFMMNNLSYLKHGDEVKFVLADRMDYDWAVETFEAYDIDVPILFSPVHGVLDPKILAGWILEDNLKVRMQIQIHKYIWGEDVEGV
ncbi:7-carboxy-7-deazaguanine synthase [PVC group bacterium (ex Bugula neritina AB1)]|nr:7-carboxy-7-deazaguanine synthase [PVC group bacterium (ex Bugula neritina AB1)]